jgi:hypothetical protein
VSTEIEIRPGCDGSRSGVSGAPNGRSQRGRSRVNGGPTHGSMSECTAPPAAEKADPRQCWVPAQKLSAARKRVIGRTVPAVRNGNICKGPGRDSVARGASRGKTFVKSRRSCHMGRWYRDTVISKDEKDN